MRTSVTVLTIIANARTAFNAVGGFGANVAELDMASAALSELIDAVNDGRDQPYHEGGCGRHYSPARAKRLRAAIANVGTK